MTPEAYNESYRKGPGDEVLTFILHFQFGLFWGFGSMIARGDLVSSDRGSVRQNYLYDVATVVKLRGCLTPIQKLWRLFS